MTYRFELDQFAIQRSAQQLDICRKDDLFAIADLYQIQVACGARKAEIKGVIHKHLIEQGVLPQEREAGAAPEMSASVGEGAEEPKPTELASIDPANLPSPSNPLLAIRLKELELELSRQQYQSQLLQVRAVELETQRANRLKELDLGLKAQQPAHFPAAEAPSVNVPVSAPVNASTLSPVPAPRSLFQVSESEFDISRQIALVPLFRESEVDTYFNVFEHIAATLKWPRTVWPLLLQCKLIGKAQEVCSALTLEHFKL